jgi:hypothetical protein
MQVPTVRVSARRARRLNQLNRKIENVLVAMRGGAALYRFHRPNSILWRLSTGQNVDAEVAHVITKRAEIVGAGDCLFWSSELSQTWRFTGR